MINQIKFQKENESKKKELASVANLYESPKP